jgi:hypothetical protein
MSPVKPVAARASTSRAFTAPEKNVNPRPIRIETAAQAVHGRFPYIRGADTAVATQKYGDPADGGRGRRP